LRSDVFWKFPFRALCSPNELVEFIVMNVEIVGAEQLGKVKAITKKDASAARHQGVDSTKVRYSFLFRVRAI